MLTDTECHRDECLLAPHNDQLMRMTVQDLFRKEEGGGEAHLKVPASPAGFWSLVKIKMRLLALLLAPDSSWLAVHRA